MENQKAIRVMALLVVRVTPMKLIVFWLKK